MEFGMQFFPDVRPSEKSARQYFDESLKLIELCDPYGYTHIRIVEHYFHHWGGYSPNPIVFLAAAPLHNSLAEDSPPGGSSIKETSTSTDEEAEQELDHCVLLPLIPRDRQPGAEFLPERPSGGAQGACQSLPSCHPAGNTCNEE